MKALGKPKCVDRGTTECAGTATVHGKQNMLGFASLIAARLGQGMDVVQNTLKLGQRLSYSKGRTAIASNIDKAIRSRHRSRVPSCDFARLLEVSPRRALSGFRAEG